MANKRQWSLMSKITLILLILILPFNVIGVMTAVLSYRSILRNTESAISHTLENDALLLRSSLSNTNSLLYNLSNNNLTLRNMQAESDASSYSILRYQFFNYLDEQRKTSTAADTFFLYLADKDDYIKVPGFRGDTVGTRPYFSFIENYSYDTARWFLSEDGKELIRIIYARNLNTYIGAVYDLSAFLSKMETVSGFESISYCFSQEQLFSDSHFLDFVAKVQDHLFLCASVSRKELGGSISFLPYALILFFILYFALIPVLYLVLKKHVNEPLRTLNNAHAQLEEGNEDYRISFPANTREFSDAYQSFNQMASSIQQLQKEVLEKELISKQLQIDYLQLQIRPHFLLNAFNVLYTLIQREQKEPSQQMILFLSDYFRYLFRSGNELQLFAKERRLIEDYMEITRIYYPVSFEVSYQIDPVLDLMRVPPLLLHSFMENIIAHALLPDRIVHIVFSGEYEDGTVTFYISDDGNGMTPEALESVRHVEDRSLEDGKNVGIKNSIKRLKYYYGDEASVECESELHVGTTFIITIPYNLEEQS